MDKFAKENEYESFMCALAKYMVADFVIATVVLNVMLVTMTKSVIDATDDFT